jgi:carboxyl-terminal processing protease
MMQKLVKRKDLSAVSGENGNIKIKSNSGNILYFVIGVVLTTILLSAVYILILVGVIKKYSDVYDYSNNIEFAFGDAVIDEKKQLINNFMDRHDAFGLRDEEEWEYYEYQSVLNMYDDDYAVYYSPEEAEELIESRKSSFKGLGVTYMKDVGKNSLVIINVYENSPAEKAGIKVGDIVESINGVKVRKMATSDVASYLDDIGDDTPLTLVLSRMNEMVTVTVNKEAIEYDYVDYSLLDDKLPYIKLKEFSGNSDGQVRAAILDMLDEIVETNTLVLDLRNNPGGEATEAAAIAGCFVGSKKILTTIESKTRDVKYYTEGDRVVPEGIKIYILVNSGTASASELLTCALQDYELDVTVVGDVTFGKGIAQSYQMFADGSCIKYTEGLYYSPKKRNIHNVGIIPDILETNSEKQLDIVKDLVGV